MSRHWSITTAIVFSLFAAPLAAQSVSNDTTVLNAAPIVIAAPSAAPAIAGARVTLAPTQAISTFDMRARAIDVAPARSAMAREGSSPAMMIVGGAAILVGAVVGGQAGGTIAVGGAVLGLFGLWNYLK